MSDYLPYLDETQRITFPRTTDEHGIAAIGGNLSPGVLLSAYEQGLFPWFNEDEPILWWNPEERAVILPGDLHISRTMQRFMRKSEISITYNQAFDAVIRSCGTIERKGQEGTWLTTEMMDAYRVLHELGYAHSVEVWDSTYSEDEPAGGLYGIRMGNSFLGESMYSYAANCSKAALIALYDILMHNSMVMIDCQVMNPHLESMGARLISRIQYQRLLKRTLETIQ